MRQKKCFLMVIIFLMCGNYNYAQKYYAAAGKDSITYLATDSGMVILTRDSVQALSANAVLPAYNKIYTRALDNENFLAMATVNEVDIYSLQNKLAPELLGSVPASQIVSIRPFGSNFVIMRGSFHGYYDQLVVGIENDTAKRLASINCYQVSYSLRTQFYPEVVYPYFFSKNPGSDKIVMFKYSESEKEFTFIDSISVVTAGFSLGQMFGGGDFLFSYEKKLVGSVYNYIFKRFRIQNDQLFFVSQDGGGSSNYGFYDEIECTDELIRINGWYKFTSNFQALTEPNHFLFSLPNLSGARIYNIPSNTQMYYSKDITNGVINSAQYIYSPPLSAAENSNPLKSFSLEQNYPNPFNPSTVINYSVPVQGAVKIILFDALGREIKVLVDEQKSPGNYQAEFSAAGLSSGVYFYQMKAGSFVETKKMLLLR